MSKAKANGNGKATVSIGDFVTRAEVNEAFQTISQIQQKLGEMFNQNQRALQNAFVLVDAHQHVSRRILEDMMGRVVRPTPLAPEDEESLDMFGRLPHRGMFTALLGQTIDYEWYFDQYNLHRCVIMMAESIRKFLKLDDEPKAPAEEPPAEEEDAIVFGGDYAP